MPGKDKKFINIDESHVHEVALYVAKSLNDMPKDSSPHFVFLHGNLGAGKTHLVRHILREFGLPKNISVTSPTFAIMNDYPIKKDVFLHIDLYRFEQGFELEELLLFEMENLKSVFIEWPERIEEDVKSCIEITISNSTENSRDYSVKFS